MYVLTSNKRDFCIFRLMLTNIQKNKSNFENTGHCTIKACTITQNNPSQELATSKTTK